MGQLFLFYFFCHFPETWRGPGVKQSSAHYCALNVSHAFHRQGWNNLSSQFLSLFVPLSHHFNNGSSHLLECLLCAPRHVIADVIVLSFFCPISQADIVLVMNCSLTGHPQTKEIKTQIYYCLSALWANWPQVFLSWGSRAVGGRCQPVLQSAKGLVGLVSQDDSWLALDWSCLCDIAM